MTTLCLRCPSPLTREQSRKAILCPPCRRALPAWVTTPRGRTREDWIADVRAYLGLPGGVASGVDRRWR